jgi:hypothetical protein
VQLVLEGVPLPSAGIREILSHKLQQLSVTTSYHGILTEVDWKGLWSALLETKIELSTSQSQGRGMQWMRCSLICSPTLGYGSYEYEWIVKKKKELARDFGMKSFLITGIP